VKVISIQLTSVPDAELRCDTAWKLGMITGNPDAESRDVAAAVADFPPMDRESSELNQNWDSEFES